MSGLQAKASMTGTVVLALAWTVRCSNPDTGKSLFSSSATSISALGHNQTPVQWVPGFFAGGKAVGA